MKVLTYTAETKSGKSLIERKKWEDSGERIFATDIHVSKLAGLRFSPVKSKNREFVRHWNDLNYIMLDSFDFWRITLTRNIQLDLWSYNTIC